MEEVDTALCLHKNLLFREKVDFLCLTSASRDFSLQVTCGWDIIDRLEETLSGEICKHFTEEMVCEV